MVAWPAPALAGDGCSDTMLMFVGEDLEVLSIASRREESASRAPAVAEVITREQLDTNGAFTLAQALDMTPGFFTAEKEGGSQPYLRGVPDSVLFLYDTVPMLSDTTKSVHAIDEELCLAPVKRIEIIRGPGSVLWGADAFAGIVNVVPMTGKDLNGIETGVWAGDPDEPAGFHVNAGHDGEFWDGFLSVSGRQMRRDGRRADLVRFWGAETGEPVDPGGRYGSLRPDRPQYLEVTANASIRDWLSVSGRFSDYSRPYAISGEDRKLFWRESRDTPVNYIKAEGRLDTDPESAIRYAGYYSSMNSDYKVIDTDFSPTEETYYGELLYDRSFLAGRGLFTGGVSLRRKEIEDAPIWDSYLPDYLGPDNKSFLPGITEKDYDTQLWSVFGQYTHKIGSLDLCIGLRQDEHDTYRDRLSYHAGAVWSASDAWTVKAVYGTAYRTPFARQLLSGDEPELEKVSTFNANVSWEPSETAEFSLGGFVNKIDDHIMEDPYAGLSNRNHQTIKGIEASCLLRPVRSLELGMNMTFLDNHGPDETYRYNDYSYIRPDGTVVKHYTDLEYPFDTGPESLANFTAEWEPVCGVTLFGRLRYFSEQELIYPRNERTLELSGEWLLDLNFAVRDFLDCGMDLECRIRNAADRDYEVPGTYSPIEGEPFTVQVMLSRFWGKR
ncbi:MAG: TonB-dependent receptor [Desulfosalsimonadaceae bacterium]